MQTRYCSHCSDELIVHYTGTYCCNCGTETRDICEDAPDNPKKAISSLKPRQAKQAQKKEKIKVIHDRDNYVPRRTGARR